jgi:hypothetical protein
VKPLAIPADAERVVIDLLTAALTDRGQDVTVGVILPTSWTPATKPHVQVALDGTPDVTYPVLWRATIRVTCWASSTTTAKALASLSLSLLASHEGGGGVYSIRPLTGVLPARDPDTEAEMASVTVEVNLRGIVLT